SLTSHREDPALDPTLDFLTNVKAGACERYAAGLALMLRSMGIPARIVKGYKGADARGAGEYVVRQSHAHAWVEAVVPADRGPTPYDWRVLDATPSLDGGPLSWARWLQQQQKSGEDLWRDLVVGYNARQQADLWQELANGRLLLQAAPVGVLLLALAGLAWAWRRRRAGAHPPPGPGGAPPRPPGGGGAPPRGPAAPPP